MRYKKFLLVPLLIFIYIFFIVDMLVSFDPTVYSTPTTSSGSGQPIGVGDRVSILVTRPYFFKLIRLPIYTNYIGYIGGYHQTFFYFVAILTVVFVIFEFFVELDWGEVGNIGKIENIGREKFEWGDTQMKIGKGKNIDLMGLVKTLGLGVLFGLIVYFVSLDGGVATGLGLLVMYLEYKLK